MPDETTSLDQFDIVIRQRPGKVSASIPALSLFVSSSDVQSALNTLEEKKKELAAELAAADMSDLVDVRPYGNYVGVREVRPTGEIGRFTLKALIIIVLISGAVLGSGALLAIEFGKTVVMAKEMTKIGGAPFWSKVEQEIARAADPKADLPEAQRQRLLENIRVIVNRWRPFVAEIAPLFSDVQNGAGRDKKPAQ